MRLRVINAIADRCHSMPLSQAIGPPAGCRHATFGMILVAIAAALPISVQAQAPDVIGCDSLVALRLFTASARTPTEASERLSSHPGCRRVSRGELGDVGQRAMIGGAPFECLAIRGSEACLWVAP